MGHWRRVCGALMAAHRGRRFRPEPVGHGTLRPAAGLANACGPGVKPSPPPASGVGGGEGLLRQDGDVGNLLPGSGGVTPSPSTLGPPTAGPGPEIFGRGRGWSRDA